MKTIRVSHLSENEMFYQAVYKWNRKKSLKTFIELYKNGFTHFTFKDIFGWRIYRIVKNTVIGRYKELETKLEKEFGKE